MQGNQFLDTNILVYAFDTSDDEKRNVALGLVKTSARSRKGILSTQVLGEFFNATVIRKQLLEPSEALLAIQGFTSTFRVFTPGTDEIYEAISLHQKYQLRYWDALILASSNSADCQTVYSEDLTHGQEYNGVQVINPFLEL